GQRDRADAHARVGNGHVPDAARGVGGVLRAIAQVVHISLQGISARLHAVNGERPSRFEGGFGNARAQVVVAAAAVVAVERHVDPSGLRAAVTHRAGDRVGRRRVDDGDGVRVRASGVVRAVLHYNVG